MRRSEINRETRETKVRIMLDLDGSGNGRYTAGVHSLTTCSMRWGNTEALTSPAR